MFEYDIPFNDASDTDEVIACFIDYINKDLVVSMKTTAGSEYSISLVQETTECVDVRVLFLHPSPDNFTDMTFTICVEKYIDEPDHYVYIKYFHNGKDYGGDMVLWPFELTTDEDYEGLSKLITTLENYMGYAMPDMLHNSLEYRPDD